MGPAGTQRARPGVPRHLNAATAAGSMQTWNGFGTTISFSIQNTHATEPIEIFFEQVAAETGVGNGYLLQPGFELDLYMEIRTFWTLSTNASSFRALLIVR